MKDAVNIKYYDNNLLSSNCKADLLVKNITELRKVEFEEFTTYQLNATLFNYHYLQPMEALYGLMIRQLN